MLFRKGWSLKWKRRHETDLAFSAATSHTSINVNTFFAENHFKVLEWPENSPDLNPKRVCRLPSN